jgi:hypothetical protein
LNLSGLDCKMEKKPLEFFTREEKFSQNYQPHLFY